MKTVEAVVALFPDAVRDRYDFSGASYHGALVPMTGILCRTHGEFQQYSAQLRKDGAGCPRCGGEKRTASRRMSLDDFLFRAEQAHPGRFSYAKTAYTNMATKVTVTCAEHGDFQINPIKLVYDGQGCPACGSRLRGKRKDVSGTARRTAATKMEIASASYAEKASAIHGGAFRYDVSGYAGMKGVVKIECRRHGWVEVHAGHHLYNRHGCPRCGQKSAAEDEVAEFLSIFTKIDRRNRTLIGPKEVDVYLPEHNLAIEYCGMYWHSHGNAEDEKKNKLKHSEKHRLCAAKGVRLITLYETEWEGRKNVIKRLLRNAIGRGRGSLMARKCSFGRPSAAEARVFYDRYHPQGGSGHGEHYGLYWKGKLVACMRFTFGSNDRGGAAGARSWTLSRYATRVSVSGGPGRLFSAFVAEVKPWSVKSFSDNRLFGGAMYEKLGFTLEKEVPEDYQVWSMVAGLRPKAHYQRRSIPDRMVEHGMTVDFDPASDPRTEAEMTYLMGARRIYDCGKKRWVWNP